jgi:hypothetical protein
MHETSASVQLSAQELEFTLACKAFVLERDAEIGRQIIITNGRLIVPELPSSRNAFLEFGLARLLKVFRLAIENKAIHPELTGQVSSDLVAFNDKIVTAFSPISAIDQIH